MIELKWDRMKVWLLAGLMMLAASAQLHAVSWLPFGPDGGDVRSFAGDPSNHAHVYMGTANGWIYESNDDGASWQRLARVGQRDDLVLDHIVVDKANPKHIVVGAWVLGHPDGGLYVSRDGGRTWISNAGMRGQSIRALAAAPENPQMLVAGALSGVYRSMDGGETWERISPLGSTEIHEIESIAIDPKDPAIIYAGTWHLPWKTTDGGDHWKNIKEGVIEDSDVFSIILDRRDPATVYASACSGIYKSGNGGELFKKVQGIPSTARRTRVLMQDPVHTDTVFAGTTEGLFRTADAGEDWLRVSAPDDIVNDVYIDPTKPDHLLVATDRGGVLMSDDGGFTYKTANKGFSARQVDAYAADPQTPARLFVGVVNDKDRGGVFVSENGGITWAQRADGLRGLDVFSLAVAPDHTVIAGTSHGIFSWSDPQWREYGAVEAPELPVQGPADPRLALTMTKSAAKHPVKAVEAKSTKVAGYNGPVYALLTAGNNVFAATEQGLLVSASSGASWRQVTGAGNETLRYVAAGGGKLLAADLRRMKVSADEGKSWKPVKMPASLTQLSGVAVDGVGELWAVGGEGIWFSPDDGLTWHSVPKLSLNDVNSVYFDATGSRMLVTANNASTFACGIHTPDKAVQCWDTGWHLRMLRPVGDHMVAATLFDGVVVQPRMVVSK